LRTPEETGGFREEELDAIAKLLRDFVDDTGAPSVSVAFGRGGAVSYAQAVGYADRDEGVEASPDTLYRIASVSKPITAVGVMALVEQGLVSLDARVFGPEGVLGERFAGPVRDPRVFDVTVEQLLAHRGGLWSNEDDDPMLADFELDPRGVIERALASRRLPHAPGSRYAYSNVGYLVLGRVIEQVTGAPYDAWISDHVLGPLGISTMALAGGGREDRAEGEATYHAHDDAEEPYRLRVDRMDAHGGWRARAADLVRFAGGVEGLLSPEACHAMWTSRSRDGYGLGWLVNDEGTAWHTGGLPGTSSLLVRRGHDGLCWAGVTNTWDGDPDLDGLLWKIVDAVETWPDVDLE
jgi:D-alanyl-D-alanine carboxypeptidase